MKLTMGREIELQRVDRSPSRSLTATLLGFERVLRRLVYRNRLEAERLALELERERERDRERGGGGWER